VQRKNKLAFLALGLVIICLSTALAAVVVMKSFTNHFTVVGVGNLAIYEYGTTTPVTAMDWGDVLPGTAKSSPIELAIKNIGNVPLWYTWNSSTLPSGFTLTAFVDTNTEWPVNHIWAGGDYYDPGVTQGPQHFVLTSTNPNQPPMTGDFTIYIYGHNTNPG
jgi:hypothetical protein